MELQLRVIWLCFHSSTDVIHTLFEYDVTLKGGYTWKTKTWQPPPSDLYSWLDFMSLQLVSRPTWQSLELSVASRNVRHSSRLPVTAHHEVNHHIYIEILQISVDSHSNPSHSSCCFLWCDVKSVTQASSECHQSNLWPPDWPTSSLCLCTISVQYANWSDLITIALSQVCICLSMNSLWNNYFILNDTLFSQSQRRVNTPSEEHDSFVSSTSIF